MWNHVLAVFVGVNLVLASPSGSFHVDPVDPVDRIVTPVVAADPVDRIVTPVVVADRVAVELVDMPAELAEMAEWAVDLFDEADLELPPMRYVHHDGDMDPCLGRQGMHHEVEGVNVVEICATEALWPTQVMILHETSHAWADHQLTPERKAAFQELRGWEYWRNYEAAAWHNNGTEQAAEIMVWGLIDRPIRIARINQAGCDDLEAGYLTLTGQAPLNGFRDLC